MRVKNKFAKKFQWINPARRVFILSELHFCVLHVNVDKSCICFCQAFIEGYHTCNKLYSICACCKCFAKMSFIKLIEFLSGNNITFVRKCKTTILISISYKNKSCVEVEVIINNFYCTALPN